MPRIPAGEEGRNFQRHPVKANSQSEPHAQKLTAFNLFIYLIAIFKCDASKN